MAIDAANARWLIPNAPRGMYAIVNVTTAASLPTDAIVVDDLSANFQRHGATANWHSVTGSKYYLEHAYWTANTYDTVENYGIWTPTTSLSGVYAVQTFIPGNYADTEQAVYKIYHNHQTATYTLSQNIYWAEWVNMGTYTFTPATASYVKLTDVTYEDIYTNWVAFDAIAFVPQIRQVYLPLALRNYPPPPPIKSKLGIHLGNHENDTWTNEMLLSIDGDKGGVWPRVIVVQSKQLWHIDRFPSGQSPAGEPDCSIAGARPIETRSNVHEYLGRTMEDGVKVIIRITPSPGNFMESILSGYPDPTLVPTRTILTLPRRTPEDGSSPKKLYHLKVCLL
jgi:hypothetical protein